MRNRRFQFQRDYIRSPSLRQSGYNVKIRAKAQADFTNDEIFSMTMADDDGDYKIEKENYDTRKSLYEDANRRLMLEKEKAKTFCYESKQKRNSDGKYMAARSGSTEDNYNITHNSV